MILIAAATFNFSFRRFIRNISCICTGKALEIVLSPAVKKPRSRVSPPTSPAAPPTQVWLLHDWWHCGFPSRWGGGGGGCWSEQAPLSNHDQVKPNPSFYSWKQSERLTENIYHHWILLQSNLRPRKVLSRNWKRQKRGRKASKQKGWVGRTYD